jgi:hypothetical protein
MTPILATSAAITEWHKKININRQVIKTTLVTRIIIPLFLEHKIRALASPVWTPNSLAVNFSHQINSKIRVDDTV